MLHHASPCLTMPHHASPLLLRLQCYAMSWPSVEDIPADHVLVSNPSYAGRFLA